MRMEALGVTGVLIGLTAPLFADPPAPREILQQAEAAIRALHAVRYEGRGEAEGVLANQIPRMNGTVTQAVLPGAELPKVRVDMQVTPPQQSQPVRLEVASDGKVVTLIEHGQKVYLRRELPAGAGLLNSVTALLIREFTLKQPFEGESKARSLTHLGTEKVGDVECDVIHAVLSGSGDEVRWHFAKSDHLPRRVQRFVGTPFGKGSITTSLSALETQPTVPEDWFRLEKPVGYGQVAPNGLLSVGDDAPDWTLKAADGREVSLRSLRGKVVLLDFWATWCLPCRKAMPGVQKLYEKYKDKPVAVLGVNCLERDPKADPVAVMKAGGFTYPLLLNGTDVARKYLVQGIPTFYLIGPDGKILLAQSGVSVEYERQISQIIEKALAKPTSGPAEKS